MKKLFKKIVNAISGKKEREEQSWDERRKELLKKVREKEPAESKSQKKQQPKKEWDKRKKELLNKAGVEQKKAGTEPKKKREPDSSRRPSPKKSAPKNTQKPSTPIREKREPVQEKKIEVSKEPEAKWNLSEFNVEPAEGKKRFHDFDLAPEIMHAIADLNFLYTTPIQAEALPPSLQGEDILGRAQTGTGKTAAFLITIINKFLKEPKQIKTGTPRALILAPTRELVVQIYNDAKLLSKYTRLQTVAILGGIDYGRQLKQLESKIDIIVATPGRILDFIKKNAVDLRRVEILVVDEADRMLDMGFIDDMHEIIRRTPSKDRRQTLLFSATISREIKALSRHWTDNHIHIDIEPAALAGESIEQTIYLTSTEEKFRVLYNLISKRNIDRAIVFATRKEQTREVVNFLRGQGISCLMLSGDVDQRKRMSALQNFKEGKFKILVATDVAGRGLHIDDVTHVINFSLPEDPEDYVHRIGRTGRAGASGKSISFACEEDSFYIPSIEKFLGKKLEYSHPEEELLEAPPPPSVDIKKEERPKGSFPPKKNFRRKSNYRRANGRRNT